jgi:O-antigen/teichoic acid export membrane protein
MVSIFVAVFGSIFTNVVVIMQSLSRYKKMYLGLILGFGFNAIMNIPFMILFGKIGLPMYYGNLVATMIGYGITIYICLHDLKKTFDISYKQTFKDFVYILITCGIMSVIILTVKHFIPMDNLSRLKSIIIVAIYGILGMAIYGAITYPLGMFNRIIGLKLKRSKK